jgi:hypothetical protein
LTPCFDSFRTLFAGSYSNSIRYGNYTFLSRRQVSLRKSPLEQGLGETALRQNRHPGFFLLSPPSTQLSNSSFSPFVTPPFPLGFPTQVSAFACRCPSSQPLIPNAKRYYTIQVVLVGT